MTERQSLILGALVLALPLIAACSSSGPTAGPPPTIPDEQQTLESLPGGLGADDETPDAPPE